MKPDSPKLLKLLQRTSLRIPFSTYLTHLQSQYPTIGNIISSTPILEGYEAANILLNTSSGRYVLKIFESDRKQENINSLVQILIEAPKIGVVVPKLAKGTKGFLNTYPDNGYTIYYYITHYYEGRNFENQTPTQDDIIMVTKSLAKLNTLDFPVHEAYDSWGNKNLVKEYLKYKRFAETHAIIFSTMNTNPNAIKVLCYGDSNTWGRDPHGSGIRYPVNVRWTGLLQSKLGNGYWIIEEGLGGRTTVIDDPKREGRNGKTYLMPCLETHNPLDIIILMLGTNDFKERLNQTAEEIGRNIEELIKVITSFTAEKNSKPLQLILLSPPYVDESVTGVKDNYLGAEKKSKKLAYFYEKVAKAYNCEFLDIARFIKPSKIDGYHLEPESHQIIADILSKKVLGMFSP